METIMTPDHPVYLVDDHIDHQIIITQAFKKIFPAITLKVFFNGMELILDLEKKIRKIPKFIVLELNMPLMCGRETLKWIRSNKTLKMIPVVILTGSQSEKDMNLCYQLGANSYIIKPQQTSLYDNLVRGFKRYLV